MSVRPAVGPAELEILGIRLRSHAGLLRLLKAEGNAVTRRVSDRFLFGGEAHADLRLGIGRAGPAHQGLDRQRLLRRVLQDPVARRGVALLHRGLGRLINAGGHEHPYLERSSDGRGRRIRTSDPLLPKQVRYQTALYPDVNRWPMAEQRAEPDSHSRHTYFASAQVASLKSLASSHDRATNVGRGPRTTSWTVGFWTPWFTGMTEHEAMVRVRPWRDPDRRPCLPASGRSSPPRPHPAP